MNDPRRLRCPALLTASLVGLTACAGSSGTDRADACPAVRIAVPSDRIGHSDNDGQIRYVATMGGLTSDCRQADDQVELDIAFDLTAERGPAFQGRPVQLSYYLVTIDPNREIVDKKVLKVRLDLKKDQLATGLREDLTLRLPASHDASGANYSLYLGFQPDQQPDAADS